MSRLSFDVSFFHLPTAMGGRNHPILSDYRASFDLKSSWRGQPVLNDGRVLIDGTEGLLPGAEGPAVIEPLVEEYWGAVEVGTVLAVQEGRRVVGFATVTKVTRPEHFTRDTAAFALQADQYCDFIQQASTLPLVSRLTEARVRLLELYQAGTALPEVEPPDDYKAVSKPVPPAAWARFDRFEIYWEVFDPYVNEASLSTTLSDDLLDVYFDVLYGLDLWRSEAPKAAAICTWRDCFDIHWGDHAVDAIRALHRACREA